MIQLLAARIQLAKMRGEEGQALVEYALIVSLIAVVAIGALTLAGTSIRDILNTIAGSVTNSSTSANGVAGPLFVTLIVYFTSEFTCAGLGETVCETCGEERLSSEIHAVVGPKSRADERPVWLDHAHRSRQHQSNGDEGVVHRGAGLDIQAGHVPAERRGASPLCVLGQERRRDSPEQPAGAPR